MIKRIGFYLILSIFVIYMGATAIYFINPYGLKTDKIRPRLFGIDLYRIPSQSMQPLLFPGDTILVSNLAYLDALPKRKDVIVFLKPLSHSSNSNTPFIKRVLAVGGDSIEIINGKLLVNKVPVEENYVSHDNNKTPYSLQMKLTQIPQNHVFVLGDNRDNSSDSRMFGYIAIDDVIAQASSIVYGKNNRSGNKIK